MYKGKMMMMMIMMMGMMMVIMIMTVAAIVMVTTYRKVVGIRNIQNPMNDVIQHLKSFTFWTSPIVPSSK
jgi:hypothetical protein